MSIRPLTLTAENRWHMQNGCLPFKHAPSKKMAPRKLNFSHLRHQKHSWLEKKLQDAGVNRKLAIISLLNFFRLKQTPVCFMMLEAFNILFGPY